MPMKSSRDVKCSVFLSCSNAVICDKRGTLTCSNYCSRQCQEAHWASHKKYCKHPYNRLDWKPAWITENRSPTFVGGDTQSHFGVHWAPEYLWGNTPAVNCFQLEHNEGVLESVEKDFNLCFAASGDIRNMVMTVNGLPDNYQGHCKILLNDRSDLVTTRNILILYALLRHGNPPELAAETAVHLMYSAALRSSDSSELSHCIKTVYGDVILSPNNVRKKSFPIRGAGSLSIAQSAVKFFDEPLAMLRATHTLKDSRKAMHDVMLSPHRVDYRDRYLSGLRPSHRLSFLRFRETGVLLHFADRVGSETFQDPNRLLFTASGKWVTMDNANPLSSWDVNEVLKTGQAYGLDHADIYGCLFFHVKAQFMEFARRVEKFHIDIHVSQLDAHVASGLLQKGELSPDLFGINPAFDRIETSNLADYVGIPSVLQDWVAVLNRENEHAVVLVYLMNWVMKQPGASFKSGMMGEKMGLNLKGFTNVKALLEKTSSMMGVNFRTLLRNGAIECAPAFYNVLENVDVFLDNHKQFEDYLISEGINNVPKLYKLQLRPRNRIYPRRSGVGIRAQPDATPSATKTELYNICEYLRNLVLISLIDRRSSTDIIGGCNPGDRYLEFGMSNIH
ncbi:hypothetical protein F5876DRAFT_87335 [Lentinula aff. lateritia]|uniref:Uncharacterized protein n=1 Tax=Lentinula aff. lateritia TaxID=2804960 RepID=A0ACC1U7T8_9AGAR|nr:hypothetical protein F5876DRAFT_87335 [Lentinula aff. lateritia]